MTNFPGILKNEEKEHNFLSSEHIMTCKECDWQGRLGDCILTMESERCGHPDYKVLLCPICNGGCMP